MSMLLHFVEYHKKHMERGLECLLLAAHYEKSKPFAGDQAVIDWNYEQAKYHFLLAVDEFKAARDKAMSEAAKLPTDDNLQKAAQLIGLAIGRRIRLQWRLQGRVLP